MLRTVLAGTVLGLAGVCPGLTLVQDGRPMAAIVLPHDASPTERSGAADLQRCLRRMSGALLPIVPEKDRPQGTCVDIGGTARGLPVRTALQQRADVGDESAVIEVTDQSVVLVGRLGSLLREPDAATGHAVYTLLEQLGVRWLQPTPAWEIVPERQTVALPEGTQVVTPFFERRSGLGFDPKAMDDNWEDGPYSRFANSARAWGRRMRLGGTRHIGAGHSYHHIVSRSRLETHPEYFGLYRGKRTTRQLCTTHPDVVHQAIRVGLGWARNSSAKYVCISPDDGTEGFCECPQCAKLRFAPGNHSDLMLELANDVARAMRAEFPDRYVTFYADYHCTGTPVQVKPEKNVMFWIPQWSVDRSQPITHPNQRRFHDALANWSRYGNPIHLYMYYGAYSDWVYYPVAHSMKVDFPYFGGHGVTGMYSETHTHWGNQGMNFYLYARLCWDPMLDVDELVREYCDLAFGPAGRTMLDYYKLLERTMAGPTPYYMGSGECARVFGPQVVAEAQKLMDRAVAEVEDAVSAGADGDLLARVTYVARAQRLAALHLGALHAYEAFGRSRDPKLLETMRANYEQELALIDHPDNEYLVKREMARRKIAKALGVLQEKLVYGPGDFSYSDYMAHNGGKSALHAQSMAGFHPGMWGLNLPPHAEGRAVWRFAADSGAAFATAVLTGVNFTYAEADLLKQRPDDQRTYARNVNGISVRSSVGGPDFITISRQRNLRSAQFDITEHVAGAAWFEIRFTASNASPNEICSLIGFGVKGRVRATQ